MSTLCVKLFSLNLNIWTGLKPFLQRIFSYLDIENSLDPTPSGFMHIYKEFLCNKKNALKNVHNVLTTAKNSTKKGLDWGQIKAERSA